MGISRIRRRRKNGQFAPSLTLPPKAPHSAPQTPHVASYARLPEHLRVSSGPMELSPEYPPSPADVVNVLRVAKARLYGALANPSVLWVSDLQEARAQWRQQATIAENHGDIPAMDAFYEIVNLSDRVQNYLSQAPTFECHHPGEWDCENCENIDVEEVVDEIIEHYTDQRS